MDLAANEEKKPIQLVGNYCLSRHAYQRLMNRTKRDSAWLEAYLRRGQFSKLKNVEGGRVFVLLYDELADRFYVSLIVPEARRIVTVLTQQQYENFHGAIPEDFFTLAKKANEEQDPILQAEKFIRARKEEDAKRDVNSAWNQPWAFVFSLNDTHAQRNIPATLPKDLKQEMLLDSVVVNNYKLFVEPYELGFLDQIDLLVAYAPFLTWIKEEIAKRQISRRKLVHLYVKVANPYPWQMDIIDRVSGALIKPVSPKNI